LPPSYTPSIEEYLEIEHVSFSSPNNTQGLASTSTHMAGTRVNEATTFMGPWVIVITVGIGRAKTKLEL